MLLSNPIQFRYFTFYKCLFQSFFKEKIRSIKTRGQKRKAVRFIGSLRYTSKNIHSLVYMKILYLFSNQQSKLRQITLFSYFWRKKRKNKIWIRFSIKQKKIDRLSRTYVLRVKTTNFETFFNENRKYFQCTK